MSRSRSLSPSLTNRELLQGSIARNRARMMDTDGDDAHYDVRSSEKAIGRDREAPPPTNSLQELMRSQQAAMVVAEDQHNKEYLPLLNKAIEAIGGNPTAHHPSGGSHTPPPQHSPGASREVSRPTSRAASRATSPQGERGGGATTTNNLKDMLASRSLSSSPAPPSQPSIPNNRVSPRKTSLVGGAVIPEPPPRGGISPSRPSGSRSGGGGGGRSPRSSIVLTSGEPNLREMLRDASAAAESREAAAAALPVLAHEPPCPPPGTIIQRARSPRATSPSFRGGVIRTSCGGGLEPLREMLKETRVHSRSSSPVLTTITTTTTATTSSHTMSTPPPPPPLPATVVPKITPLMSIPSSSMLGGTGSGLNNPFLHATPRITPRATPRDGGGDNEELDSTVHYLDQTQDPQ